MRVKLILPSPTEAKSPFWRPIKYSLFPPLGLATLAAYLSEDDEAEIIDMHVEELKSGDTPDLVLIQVYITNAYRAYAIADFYRSLGCHVALGGLHVTSLPEEASMHADTIFLGPAEQSFPEFLRDFRNKQAKAEYRSLAGRSIQGQPPIRRDLIKREKYLVPNSLVISRGCPHECDFCYKHAFYKGGRSYYTQHIDEILAEIERLPGRHLYFLDDHLFANPKLAKELFKEMRGMKRVFQAAATVSSIANGKLIEDAADAGLRSLFVGFETLSDKNLQQSHKSHSIRYLYDHAIRRLHELRIMINASFVFGFDGDDRDVFKRTVAWAVDQAVTTTTFHVLTPYPGTRLFDSLKKEGRILSENWEKYDTRHAVFQPANMSVDELEEGYKQAYHEFYRWSNIFSAAFKHGTGFQKIKHLAYAGAWKKFEPFWDIIIKAGGVNRMLPLLEMLLSNTKTPHNISPVYESSPLPKEASA